MAFFAQDQQWYWAVVVVSMGAAYWKNNAQVLAAAPVTAESEKEPRPNVEAAAVMPDELIRSVLGFVDAASLAKSASSVCRRWRKICESDEIWRALWIRDFSEAEEASRRIQGSGCEMPEWALKRFYSLYSVSWVERALVGSNVENSRVHIGLHGSIYDVTAFCRRHPGSPETLLDFGGSDATVFFEDVGHSTDARKFAKDMLLVRGPRTGALASVKAQYDAEKVFVSSRNRRTVTCPACRTSSTTTSASSRPFWNAETHRWCVWWSCCGANLDSLDQPPPALAPIHKKHQHQQQQLLILWKNILSSHFSSDYWNLSALKSKYVTDFRILRS